MSDKNPQNSGHAAGSGVAAVPARARLALASATIGSWAVFLGLGIVNDLAGPDTVREPVELVALPTFVALAVLVRHRRAVGNDRSFRGQLTTVAFLSGITGAIGCAFASNPFAAAFWGVCAVVSIATCVLANRWKAP